MKNITLSLLIAFFVIPFGTINAQKKDKKENNQTNKEVVFYIARHGKTLLNTTDRVQGWADGPLTSEGTKVAEQLGKGLKDISFKSVHSSDLGRAMNTASVILNSKEQIDLTIQPNQGLRETCFGSFEGDLNSKMWGDVALFLQYKSSDELLKAVTNIGLKPILDTGKILDKMNMFEDYDTVKNRTKNALIQIAEKEAKNGGGNILLVSHGMAISIMLQDFTDKKIGYLGNASVCKVTYKDGKFTVDSIGDMSYVEKGKTM